MSFLEKLYTVIEIFPNKDFRKFLELGLDKDYTNRENEDKIIEVLENMIKKASIDENKESNSS